MAGQSRSPLCFGAASHVLHPHRGDAHVKGPARRFGNRTGHLCGTHGTGRFFNPGDTKNALSRSSRRSSGHSAGRPVSLGGDRRIQRGRRGWRWTVGAGHHPRTPSRPGHSGCRPATIERARCDRAREKSPASNQIARPVGSAGVDLRRPGRESRRQRLHQQDGRPGRVVQVAYTVLAGYSIFATSVLKDRTSSGDGKPGTLLESFPIVN